MEKWKEGKKRSPAIDENEWKEGKEYCIVKKKEKKMESQVL